MYCGNCGKELKKEENFCSNCGLKIEKNIDEQNKNSNNSTKIINEQQHKNEEIENTIVEENGIEECNESKAGISDTADLILTILLGIFGVHKLTQKKYKMALLYLCTLGLFLVGWIYDIYTCIYYLSDKFKKVKESIKENAEKCNELNRHIEDLKNSYVDIKHIDYGTAEYKNSSVWNYRRPLKLKFKEANNIYNCSRTIVSNASNQPFKYVCKYFNIDPNEENLEKFEKILNDFSAAEQGKELLKNERDELISSISGDVPLLIRLFNKKRLIQHLGFLDIDFSQLYFPKYTFNYISSGGYSGMKCDVIFNISNLDKFIDYLSTIVKFRKSAAGQRALMTSSLREKIKERDHYTCCYCKNSIKKEPNLLLEIDHIIPISKGGITSENNLQTLCWKCNRSKGAKNEVEVKKNIED